MTATTQQQVEQITAAWTEALRDLDRARAHDIGRQAMASLGPSVFGDRVISATLQHLGAEWEQGRCSLAEVYMAGRISAEVIEAEAAPMANQTARIGIALLDDHHGLGKTLVKMSLQAAGIPIHDFGTMAAEALADAAVQAKVGLLFVSTLMLRSAMHVTVLVERLEALGGGVRVVVGGAPFRLDPKLWEAVGAHGFGNDASEAVRIARDWLQEQA